MLVVRRGGRAALLVAKRVGSDRGGLPVRRQGFRDNGLGLNSPSLPMQPRAPCIGGIKTGKEQVPRSCGAGVEGEPFWSERPTMSPRDLV